VEVAMSEPIRQFLFMGEQLETLDRGRIYDGTGEESNSPIPSDGSEHGTHFEGPCVCGRAFCDVRCESKEDAK
jgi:hypothetical protein